MALIPRQEAGTAAKDKSLRDIGRAAGLTAAVLAAGVATSALAIDIDLAVAGALVAAGAVWTRRPSSRA